MPDPLAALSAFESYEERFWVKFAPKMSRQKERGLVIVIPTWFDVDDEGAVVACSDCDWGRQKPAQREA